MKSLAAAFCFCCIAHGAAYAHAALLHASPAADSIVSAVPQEVTLTFTDTLEAAFSNLKVTDGNGTEVSQGKTQVNNNTMRVGLRSLNAGVYKVNWRAVSTDTHRTDGSFTFRVNAQ
jgi:copper resistance protein C